MAEQGDRQPLDVLIANGEPDWLEQLEGVVRGLGHNVVVRAVDPERLGSLTRQHQPDIALVGVGRSSEHALALIDKIVAEAACPVVCVLHGPDPAFVAQAARRGMFAYVTEETLPSFQSAIEIVLQRFDAFRNLEGAFGRRAAIEQAKGILMERHHIDDRKAFELLSRRSQDSGRKVAEIARAVCDSFLVLPSETSSQAGAEPTEVDTE